MGTIIGGNGDDVLVGTNVGNIVRVSASPTTQNFGSTYDPKYSPDGTKVVFSTSTSLLPADTNLGSSDIYVKNLVTGEVALVSATAAGLSGNSWAYDPVFSPDGAKVMFRSASSNLVAGDTNSADDIFVKDLATGAITRISVGAGGQQVNLSADSAVFSPDGTKVAFAGGAYGFPLPNGNIFLKDLTTGALTLVSANAAGVAGTGNDYAGSSMHPVFSPDGTKVGFQSYATNLVADDPAFSDLFIKDLATGAVTKISTDSAGARALGDSSGLAFSPDGTKVLFLSGAANLVAGDTNGAVDIFLKDLTTGAVSRVSTGAAGEQSDYGAVSASFSPDGTKVVFASYASNLVAGDTNGAVDVFLKNLTTGAIVRVSTGLDNVQANDTSSGGALSPDGTKVIFTSFASNLASGDTNGGVDIFIKELAASGIDLISGGGGNDQLTGLGGDDTLSGQDGNDVLLGDDYDVATLDGADTLSGGDGNDVIVGGRGADILHGDAGDDILVSGMARGSLSASGVAGTGTYSTIDGGDDQLDGGTGNDTAILTYTGRSTQPIVFDNSNIAAQNTISVGGVAHGSVTNVENIRFFAGAGDDHLTGGSGDDLFYTGGGHDVVDGGAGVDSISYDQNQFTAVTVVLNGASDATVFFNGGAKDTILNVENIGGSQVNDNLTGDALANTLKGFNGDDVLIGLGGADILDGGAGSDTAFYDEKTLAVVVTLNGATDAIVTVGGVAEDTLRNIENLVGGQGADVLTGDDQVNLLDGGAGDNALHGGGGNDTLMAGAGNDVFDGGAGVDIVDFGALESGVTVNLGTAGPQDTGHGLDTFTNVEVLQGSSGDDALIGDNAENGLIGGLGQDWLQGGGGADVLAGGGGHDSVWGGDGDDFLEGGDGDDTIWGGAGNDTVSYLTAQGGVFVDLAVVEEQNTGGGGVDTLVSIENLIGSAHDDYLSGDAKTNVVDGGAGDDEIYGAGGGDVLTGGDGVDTFYYEALSESTPSAPDRITDFVESFGSPSGMADMLILWDIDADTRTAGDQAFHIGATAGHTGDLVLSYDAGSNTTTMSLYVNNDAVVDGVILLSGWHMYLSTSDILL